METMIGFLFLIFVFIITILIMRAVGAWMFRINELIENQLKLIKELKHIREHMEATKHSDKTLEE